MESLLFTSEQNSSILFKDGDINFFGPTADAAFDFTPLFEDTFFSLIPSALLLLVLPYRLFTLRGQRPKVARGGFLYEAKLLFMVAFAAMNLVLLAVHALNSSERTKVTIAAAALTFVSTLGLCVLSHLEHIRSIRPSVIMNGYLLFTLIFDIARLRTLFITYASRSIAGCFASMVAVKVMVLFIEATEKRGILLEPYRNLSPEETSGIYSRSFFFWLNWLMTTGFRRLLHNNDLYPIDTEMSSAVLREKMQQVWNASSKESSRSLFWAVLRANLRPFLLCIIPRLSQGAFRYAQPFLLARTISFANDLSQPEDIGWGLTGGFFFVLLGLAVSNGWYYHMTYRLMTSVRGSLISIIYSKTVDLSITALDESVAVTLMSSDTQTICNGFQFIHEFWAVPLELAVAVYLLSRQLGVVCAAPVVLALVSTVGILAIANLMGQAQKSWMKSIQTRVDVTATMLGSMKSVKMLGFTDWLGEMVQGLRVTELAVASLFRKLLIFRVALANLMLTLAPFTTFAFYSIVLASQGHILDAETAYTVLTLISLLGTPMNDMIRTVPMMNAAMASLNRIQGFLQSDARRDNRLYLDDSASTLTDPPVEEEGIQLQSPANSAHTQHSQLIVARDVSFSWTHDEKPVVRDVNFSVSRGHLCIIIGPVGSGKSTLLKGILGETLSTKGFLYTNFEECAFVDQTPWIRNATLRDNIIGLSDFDEEWYRTVIKGCALDQDIAILPNGHFTNVGTAGISLSGGQKQRVALARAVYARKNVILLDDIFSGLDADTEERIFARLFSQQGLFRKLGSTVLLVTHAVHRLSYADLIIAMTADGSIAEQGSFDLLKASAGYVAMLEAQYKAEKAEEEDTKQNQNGAHTTAIEEEKEEQIIQQESTELHIAQEDLTRQSGDLSLYAYYLRSVHWASSAFWASCYILCGVANKLSEFVVNMWTEATEIEGNSANGFYLGIYGLLAFITIFGLVVGAYHYILYFAPKSAKNLHQRLLTAVMNAPLSFFTSVDVGTTTNRFSQDMTLIDNDLPYAMVDFMLSLSMGIMSAILMCISARYFAATMPPILLLMWMLQKFYLRTSRQMRLLDLEAKSPLFSQFIESLSGLVTIRAFGWSSRFEEQNLILLDASQKPYYLLFCIQRWLELTLDLTVTGLGVILMVMIVKLRSEVSAGYVGLAILNVITFSQSLSEIIRMWTNLETSIGSIARIREFVKSTENENRPDEDLPLVDGDSQPWPPKGAIDFRNISASYNNKSGNKKLIIKNLSLSIRAGEKIGICGRSGSGKSSLLATLFRMLEIEAESCITIDGVDITRAPRQKLRAALNAIPQEPFLIRGTVRVNADPLGTHTTEEITEALRSVELWDLVQEKGGIEADLDSNFFSHGQRQLFSLARALLRGGKIIVLDEVTSNVDVVSDALMQRVIREKFSDCTILAVAHRLDTIMDFDRVALMQDGELVELDSPQALLARESAFRELYESKSSSS
ncbi:ATP-binding cassette transporter, putative [Talaromyces stipitatus ATCC 10500]|uniref:ATP-binding cassette transporter, putative n=1 Tax=Talaromyces stipitatus (strain ATCC 10500 / CBS 375.48 / QM 6759 / NRRL 1006) TaxID=441959 RepID=B8MCC7_TALSN|nr:ATP-binding cassette transporter, putative [Talaromyces stipitatus ATCC 10500]EED18573.1 ATP-binding cassette transporter, putative [Talaromyces stipitatus ATCC 10500]